jgi:hypothetical protein
MDAVGATYRGRTPTPIPGTRQRPHRRAATRPACQGPGPPARRSSLPWPRRSRQERPASCLARIISRSRRSSDSDSSRRWAGRRRLLIRILLMRLLSGESRSGARSGTGSAALPPGFRSTAARSSGVSVRPERHPHAADITVRQTSKRPSGGDRCPYLWPLTRADCWPFRSVGTFWPRCRRSLSLHGPGWIHLALLGRLWAPDSATVYTRYARSCRTVPASAKSLSASCGGFPAKAWRPTTMQGALESGPSAAV